MSEGNQGRNRTQPAPPAANTPPADEPRAMTDAEKAAALPQMEAAANHALDDLRKMTEERDAAIDERDASLKLRDAARADAQTLRAQLAEARADVDALAGELTELRTTRSKRADPASSVITRVPSEEAKAKAKAEKDAD